MKTLLFVCFCIVAAFAEDTEVQQFALANNEFSGSLYTELLVDNQDNLLFSPFSVETLLALTQSGTMGDTGAEIRSALNLPETKEETDALVEKVLPTIHNQGYSLHTTNKIYVEENFPIKEDFKTVATNSYEASFQNIDFTQSAEAANEINKWVEEETQNKIHDLVHPEDLTDQTRLVLINALYFKANWTFPFDDRFSKKKTFYTSEEETIESVMMFQQMVPLNYFESEELDAQILELPFEGGGAMVIVLPNKKEGIALLEKQGAALLAAPKFSNKFVNVLLPKFKIESSIELSKVLQNLGIVKAFGGQADLSGIAGEPGELIIGKIRQKSFIDVNEIGVEAISATVGFIPPPSIETPDKYFTADHPFVFYIKVNDIVLFEGRVLVPEYEEE